MKVEVVRGGEIGIGAPARDQTISAVARKKTGWAEVAKEGNNGHRIISQLVRPKLMRAKQMLGLNLTRVITEPCTNAVYFKKVRHWPFGKIGEAQRECPPTWGLLGISYVGE